MTQGNSSKNWLIRILGASAFAGLLAMIALVSQIVSSRNDDIASKTQQANQGIQIAQQQTQIALANEQNQLQSQQLTLAAQQSSIEGQLLTPVPSDFGDSSLTAIAVIIQATQIEAKSQAIATRQKGIEETQMAVGLESTSTEAKVCPSVLPTRVKIGMTIEVTTSGKVPKLGIRPQPNLDVKKEFELLSGDDMTVLDGPSCSNNSYFWYISSQKGKGWVREGNDEFYFVDPVQ